MFSREQLPWPACEQKNDVFAIGGTPQIAVETTALVVNPAPQHDDLELAIWSKMADAGVFDSGTKTGTAEAEVATTEATAATEAEVTAETETEVAAEAKTETIDEAPRPYDTVDLEMWPQTADAGETRFREAVREAAISAGGELLFDLPAEGLVADRLRIAVARIPDDNERMRVVLATLDQDGAEIHLQMPDASTAHLVGFADAFVGLLRSIGAPAEPAAEAMPPVAVAA